MVSKKAGLKIIEEYKKFIILTIGFKNPVFPSNHVEVVWNIHKAHNDHYCTKFYNDLLIPEIPKEARETVYGGLEKVLNPEAREQAYKNTLKGYTAFFGEDPEQNLWDSPEKRFGYVL